MTSPHLCGLLAPLFKPNLSPDKFLEMYNATIELAVKEGPAIAFQLFTKVCACLRACMCACLTFLNHLLFLQLVNLLVLFLSANTVRHSGVVRHSQYY